MLPPFEALSVCNVEHWRSTSGAESSCLAAVLSKVAVAIGLHTTVLLLK